MSCHVAQDYYNVLLNGREWFGGTTTCVVAPTMRPWTHRIGTNKRQTARRRPLLLRWPPLAGRLQCSVSFTGCPNPLLKCAAVARSEPYFGV
jgi:hypothetical protein